MEQADTARVRRFRALCSLASLAAVLAVVTLVWREWIELVFRVDPDGGDGSLEWAIVVAAGAASAALGMLARLEWRRLTPAGGRAQ